MSQLGFGVSYENKGESHSQHSVLRAGESGRCVRARLAFLTASDLRSHRSQSPRLQTAPLPVCAFNASLCQARCLAQVKKIDRAPPSASYTLAVPHLSGSGGRCASVFDSPLLSCAASLAATSGMVLRLAALGHAHPNSAVTSVHRAISCTGYCHLLSF